MFCRQKIDRQTTDKEVRRFVTEFSQFDEKYHVVCQWCSSQTKKSKLNGISSENTCWNTIDWSIFPETCHIGFFSRFLAVPSLTDRTVCIVSANITRLHSKLINPKNLYFLEIAFRKVRQIVIDSFCRIFYFLTHSK